MISFTVGYAFRIVCVSANALSRSSSLGRTPTSFRFGYFSLSRFLMWAIHSFWFAALSAPVMIANSPLPPRSRAASSISVLPIPSGVAWLTKKSRASGSASASQVTTLMPRWRALRSTVEMPSRFSTATAITSTPRVIQVSTTSFCLAGVEVGRAVPDQLDAELPRRLLGAGAAADEVRIALALGIIAIVGGGRDAAALAPRSAVRDAGSSERTSHTLVPATMSAAGRTVAQSTAT